MISRVSQLLPLLQPEELIYPGTDKAAAAELQDRSGDTLNPQALCTQKGNSKLDGSQPGAMGNNWGS